MEGALHVGTSGFAFDAWKGPFYPEKIKSKDMLAHYASRLSSVEINYTFRRTPSTSTLETWRATTPDGFFFAVKAHQRITHVLRLANAEEVTQSFLERLGALGPRLGPVLFQCPPNLKFDRGRIEAFLECLPPKGRYAFEFRNPSWGDEARALLASRGVTFCAAETDDEPLGDDAIGEAPLAYLRLRKTSYSPAELAAWARRVERALARGVEVFCYFKHEDEGIGPRLATELATMIGADAKASPPRVVEG
jgi:uncharacterized protein YecE (DUF72 family)